MKPNSRVLAFIGTGALLLAGCGRSVLTGGQPCPAVTLHASPGSEELRATFLPAAFTQTQGAPDLPGQGVTYVSGTATLVLQRMFGTEAPGYGALTSMARVTSTVTVQGQPGLVATNFNLPFGATGVEVVWKDGPDVNPVATGNGISRDEVLAVAQGVNYNAGDWPGPAPSSGCIGGIRVEGAISRSQALSDVPGSYAARLVRLTDLSSATGDELSQCTVKRCDPLVVVWIVASHDAGPMPRPSGATLPQGSALSIAVLNAASGANRGDSESGNGPLPAWWGTIRDYGQG